MCLERRRGQPVAQHEEHLAGDAGEVGLVGETAAQVGAAQVGGAIRGGGGDGDRIEAFQLLLQHGEVERRMHRIAGAGMGELKLQVGAGGQARPAATQPDPGRGGRAQAGPGIGAAHPASSRRRVAARSSVSWPVPDTMPVLASQVSNSGAARRPKVLRR